MKRGRGGRPKGGRPGKYGPVLAGGRYTGQPVSLGYADNFCKHINLTFWLNSMFIINMCSQIWQKEPKSRAAALKLSRFSHSCIFVIVPAALFDVDRDWDGQSRG